MIVALPAATPVTTPEDASTVAADVLSDVQVPPESPSVDNEEVPVGLMLFVPLMVPAFGNVVMLAEPVATFSVVAPVLVQVIFPPSPLDAPVVVLT